MMKKIQLSIVFIIVVVLLGSVIESEAQILERVQQRGFLTCGVSFSNVLFGEKQGLRGAVGFDMDYCRAMASAVFGRNIQNRLVFLELSSNERFEVLRNGTADVVVRTTTNTIGRDVVEQVAFTRPNFYDGQDFLVKIDSGIETIADLDVEGNTVCVAAGSSSLLNVQGVIQNAELITLPDESECAELLHNGEITSVTSDATVLQAFKQPDEKILGQLISREPLSVVTDERDVDWSGLARWVINGLVLAESYGVHKQNINEIDIDSAPAELVNLLDSSFGFKGIRSGFMSDVFDTVGVYGDIYSRHIGAAISRFNTLNELWLKNGIQYSESWGGPSEDPFTPKEYSGTPVLQEIRDRGYINCGCKYDSPLFAQLDESTLNDPELFEDVIGFDTEFCKAVSVAIFAGLRPADETIGALATRKFTNFIPVTSANRFFNLNERNIDVLVRQTTATLGRDMINAGQFTRPNFYDGQGVMVRDDSGINSLVGFDSPFFSYCVATGTTTLTNALDFFSAAVPVEFPDEAQAKEAYLAGGQCTGFSTDKSGLADAARPGIDRILAGELSREPLTLVTNDYDQKFFELVDWVRNGIVIAEIYGITSDFILSLPDPLAVTSPQLEALPSEAQRLLGVNNYNETGIDVDPMFMRYVIAQFGNYGEIYDRYIEDSIAREGTLNALFTNGGVLYAPPWNGQAEQVVANEPSSANIVSTNVFSLLFFVVFFILLN